MARKAPKNRMSLEVGMPEMDKHEKMLDEMHGALYSLSDKIRKPYPRSGEKLLPKELQPEEAEGSKAARKHIETLHESMKGCK
jgi:hypothetical protein